MALRGQRELLRRLAHPAYLGRFFHGSDEHGPDSAPYVVLSYAYWQSHYQGDPGVVGRTVLLNKYPFTVIGVAPPRFRGTALFFVARSLGAVGQPGANRGREHIECPRRRGLWIIGRLKSGVSVAQAQRRSGFHRRVAGKDLPERRRWREFSLARPELMGDYIGKRRGPSSRA